MISKVTALKGEIIQYGEAMAMRDQAAVGRARAAILSMLADLDSGTTESGPSTIQDALVAAGTDLDPGEQEALASYGAAIYETSRNVASAHNVVGEFFRADLLDALATIRDSADAAWTILNADELARAGR